MNQMRGRTPAGTEVQMYILSDKFGWTPKQIKEQDWEDIENYLHLINIENQIQKAEEKRHKTRYGR